MSIYQKVENKVTNPIRLLIAEDDTRIAEIQKRFVERIEGFEIIGIAHTTQDTRDLIEVFNPHVILLDIYFPDGSGLDLLRDIRTQNSAIDVVLITAAKEVNSLQTAMHCGVFDYILKPLVFERLQETLLSYQQRHQRLQHLESLDQQQVDHLLNTHTSAKPITTLPKGIDNLTLQKIQSAFMQTSDPSYSAEELGKIVGVSRTTARRYLEFLVTEQFIKADISYGTVGRPERRYWKC